MNRGYTLSLRMGGFQAELVPQAVVDALTELQVSTTVGAQSGFQMKFTLGRNSVIGRSLLPSGYFDPRRRVIIAVRTNGSQTVLMDGVITRQDVTPGAGPGQSTLTVLIEFESVEGAQAAHDTPAYQEALAALGDGAVRDIRIVPGLASA